LFAFFLVHPAASQLFPVLLFLPLLFAVSDDGVLVDCVQRANIGGSIEADRQEDEIEMFG